ncbi:hypothetical protein H5410_040353 [Solanum commersonii]|uniref:Uncharacterized protein n=1 Tax=Solanum commersonii TaxID=4109 RepID=A0A9J5XQP6_SOLCO|nr:hypothetical protein H5410_040353 [Solanum commersonii]
MSLMYFFIEFSIPWILKWSIEVDTTSDGFPCLQRTFYTKFWSKLLEENQEGHLHGQEILDLINVKISGYYNSAINDSPAMDDFSPFKKITRKLQMKKGVILKLEAIALYMEEVKKDLMKNLEVELRDDTSMASTTHTNDGNEEACLAGEGKNVDSDEEIDIEAILQNYQRQNRRIF